MDIIYNLLINDIPLTNGSLHLMGYTDDDINVLLDDKLCLKEDLSYELRDVHGLYLYGLKLLKSGESRDGTRAIRICHELDKNNREYILSLMIRELTLNHYLKLYDYLHELEDNGYEEYFADNSLYLFLLSKLMMPLDLEFKGRIERMDASYMYLPEFIDENYPFNEVRYAIVSGKYKYALSKLNDLLAKGEVSGAENILTKTLLIEIISKEERFHFQLLNYAKQRKYKEILEAMRRKMKNNSLTQEELNIMSLANDVIEIVKTKKIPDECYISSNITEAIHGKCYSDALSFNNEYLENMLINPDDDILNIMLKDILQLITSIELSDESLATLRYKNMTNIYPDVVRDISDFTYYLNQEGIGLKDAIMEFNLTKEQINLIKLVIAKDYYINHRIRLGDILVDDVKKSGKMSDNVRKYLEEVVTNKSNYENSLREYVRKKIYR